MSTAGPNANGQSKLAECALCLDPTAVGSPNRISSKLVNGGDGNRYLTISVTRPTGPDASKDVLYLPECTMDLSSAI